MATRREIMNAIQDDWTTRHPDRQMAEIRITYASVCLTEATETAFMLSGELMLNDSPENIARLVEQFDQWSDAYVDLIMGR